MKQRFVLVILMVSALSAVGLSAQVALAQSGTPATVGASTNVITLGAGKSASIPVNFWCLDFGKPFPIGVTGPSGVAPAKVASVLAAAKSAGTINSDPYQTQLAVWYASDNTWHDTGSTGHMLAQQLVTMAGSAPATPAATSPSLDALVGSRSLTVVVQNFQAVSDNSGGLAPFRGTGNLMVTNTSSQSVIFVLDGAVFQPTNAGAQTLFAQSANAPTVLPTTGTSDNGVWMLVLPLLGALSLLAGFGLSVRRAPRKA